MVWWNNLFNHRLPRVWKHLQAHWSSKPKGYECQHQRTDWDKREIFMFWGLYSPLDAEGRNSATLEQWGSWARMECASGTPALASLTVFSFSFSAQCFFICSLRPACLSLTQPARPRNWWKLSVLCQCTAGSFRRALSLSSHPLHGPLEQTLLPELHQQWPILSHWCASSF